LAVRLVRFARDRGGKVWWDCHYKGDGLRDADLPDGRIAAMRNLKASIACLVPDHDFRIAPLEENGAAHDMGRAISHAHNFNTLARMGSYLPAVAVANTLQASGQELVWSQGRTFFTASKVWFQPPWYVDQMISGSPAPNVVAADVAGPRDALDALARMTEDRKALVLQVVNVEPAAVEAAIVLDGFRPARPAAAVAEIGGDLQLENTLEAPARVVPARREWEHKAEGGAMTYTFPPYSFTILRFE
jgi:alpha-L-arabinofuranosidase